MSRLSSQQVRILPWSSPGVTKLLFLESICWPATIHLLVCVYPKPVCYGSCQQVADPAVSVGGMFSVLWELTLRMGDKEKEKKVIGAGATAVQTTNWRQREGGGGSVFFSCDGTWDSPSQEEMEEPDLADHMGKRRGDASGQNNSCHGLMAGKQRRHFHRVLERSIRRV